MRLLGRIIRTILTLALVLIALVFVSLAILRLAAAGREIQSIETAAPPGGHFVTVGGLAMHYRSWGPSEGQPLILIHGTLAWADTFRDIAIPLGERGFRVLAPDLPPFGFSARPPGHDYSRTAQAERILGFADTLGIDHFVLGVHSYGGGAAMEAAFSAPQRIDGLVLMDVALGLGQRTARPPSLLEAAWLRETLTAATLTNPMATAYGLRSFIANDGLVTDARTALYQRPFVVAGTTEAIGHWLISGLLHDESSAASSLPALYTAFDRPTLLIWGREDSVTPLAQGENLDRLLKNGRLEVLDGVNHIPQVEKPAEVVTLIDAFMRGLPEGGGDKAERLPGAATTP